MVLFISVLPWRWLPSDTRKRSPSLEGRSEEVMTTVSGPMAWRRSITCSASRGIRHLSVCANSSSFYSEKVICYLDGVLLCADGFSCQQSKMEANISTLKWKRKIAWHQEQSKLNSAAYKRHHQYRAQLDKSARAQVRLNKLSWMETCDSNSHYSKNNVNNTNFGTYSASNWLGVIMSATGTTLFL